MVGNLNDQKMLAWRKHQFSKLASLGVKIDYTIRMR